MTSRNESQPRSGGCAHSLRPFERMAGVLRDPEQLRHSGGGSQERAQRPVRNSNQLDIPRRRTLPERVSERRDQPPPSTSPSNCLNPTSKVSNRRWLTAGNPRVTGSVLFPL
jgi:hypothetical protein